MPSWTPGCVSDEAAMTTKNEPTATDESQPLTVENRDDLINPISTGFSPLSDLESVQAEQATRKGERNISRGRLVFRRLRRKRLAMFGALLLVAEALLAFIGPRFSDWSLDELDFSVYGFPEKFKPSSE